MCWCPALMLLLKPCAIVDYFLPFSGTTHPPLVEYILPDLQHAQFCLKCAILLGALSHYVYSFVNPFISIIIY